MRQDYAFSFIIWFFHLATHTNIFSSEQKLYDVIFIAAQWYDYIKIHLINPLIQTTRCFKVITYISLNISWQFFKNIYFMILLVK